MEREESSASTTSWWALIDNLWVRMVRETNFSKTVVFEKLTILPPVPTYINIWLTFTELSVYGIFIYRWTWSGRGWEMGQRSYVSTGRWEQSNTLHVYMKLSIIKSSHFENIIQLYHIKQDHSQLREIWYVYTCIAWKSWNLKKKLNASHTIFNTEVN